MHVLERANCVVRRSFNRAKDLLTDRRKLSIRITNGTDTTLRVDRTQVVAGSLSLSFTELAPGQAGVIRFCTADGFSIQATSSLNHHAGVVELVIGAERIYVAQAHRMGQSLKRKNAFMFFFSERADALKRFYMKMQNEFMGMPGMRSAAEGDNFTAYAVAASHTEIDMVVSQSKYTPFKELESAQLMCVAELCSEHRPEHLLHALFVNEYNSVFKAQPDVEVKDRAFTLDSMISAFVLSGLLGLSEQALQMNLRLWKSKRAHPLVAHFGLLEWARYDELDEDLHDVEAHVESAHLLLSAAVHQTIRLMHGVAIDFRQRGLWQEVERRKSTSYDKSMLNPHSDDKTDFSFVDKVWTEHLIRPQKSARTTASSSQGRAAFSDASFASTGSVIDRLATFRRDSLQSIRRKNGIPMARRKVGGRVTQLEVPPEEGRFEEPRRAAIPSWNVAGSLAMSPPEEPAPVESLGDTEQLQGEVLLKILVRHCIQTANEHVLRRSRLYDTVVKGLAAEEDVALVKSISRDICLTYNVFEMVESCGLPATVCKVWSLEGLSNLDDGRLVNPMAVLKSAGVRAVMYSSVTTNSRSGEFFFKSHDGKFLIKTISENEAILMRKMFTAYHHHIRERPRSFIVRFAGLFHVEASSVGMSQYFVMMRSVFDADFSLHECYDLKGALHHRKAEKDAKVGKDQDFLDNQRTINLPTEIRREVSEMHEMDIELLRRFDVMDYSLLVGIHDLTDNREPSYRPASAVAGQRYDDVWKHWSHGTVLSEDGNTLYFLGLIDFLIMYNLKKQTENMIKTMRGHGEDTACVSPPEFALRQAAFVRERVLACRPNEPGTMGLMHAEIRSARDLLAMDWTGKSDPFVRITLGLISRQTEVWNSNCNPFFNCMLSVPANAGHVGKLVDISVWDHDSAKQLQGSHDFLGRIVVPIHSVLKGPVCFTDEPLLDVSQGRLSVTLTFTAVEDCCDEEELLTLDSTFAAFNTMGIAMDADTDGTCLDSTSTVAAFDVMAPAMRETSAHQGGDGEDEVDGGTGAEGEGAGGSEVDGGTGAEGEGADGDEVDGGHG